MTTTVARTIGSGGDYPTLAAWWADNTAFGGSADLVATDTAAVGNVLSAAEITGTTQLLNAVGYNTNASPNNITLQAAPGQSFRDNPSVRTNALRYNPSNGAAIRSTFGSNYIIHLQQPNLLIKNLQFSAVNFGVFQVTQGPVRISNCITFDGGQLFASGANDMVIDNCLFEVAIAAGDPIVVSTGGSIANLFECTIVSPSDLGAADFMLTVNTGATLNIKNSAIFANGGGVSTGVGTIAYTTCATDGAGATGLTGGLTYANQFVSTLTSTASDFRQKTTGGNLQGTGTAETTYGNFDISGLARPQGSNWDIGAWELAVASGAATPFSFFRAPLTTIGVGYGIKTIFDLKRNPIRSRRRLITGSDDR